MGTSWNTEAIKIYAYQLGKRIARQRVFSLFYLYNGVKLRKIPERDVAVYPFVYVGYSKVSRKYAVKFLSEIAYNSTFTEIYYDYSYTGKGNDSWEDDGKSTHEYGYNINSVIWANFDIISPDGIVLVEASEPIPV